MTIILILSVFYGLILYFEENKWEKNKWTDLTNSGN
jgi:hypothetical protein